MPEFYEYESGDPYVGYVPTAAQAAVLGYAGATLEDIPSGQMPGIQVGSIPAGTELLGLWAAGGGPGQPPVGYTPQPTPSPAFVPLGGIPPSVVAGYGGLGGGEPGAELMPGGATGEPTLPGGIMTAGGPGLLLAGGTGLTLGFLKGIWATYGPTVLKALVGGGVFATIMKLLTGGAPDNTPVSLKAKKKRYSIGTNPRLSTLLKVGKRVDNIFVAYDKRISKFRSRLRGTSRTTRARRPTYGPTQYLSAVERKALARR